MALQRLTHSGIAPPTNLTSPISATSTIFTIANGVGYPTGATAPFVIDIDAGTSSEEKILCASLAGTTITVYPGGRGFDGTTATAHSPSPSNVTHVCSSAELDDANAHIYVPSRDDHPQYSLANGARGNNCFVIMNHPPTVPPTSQITVPFDGIAWDPLGAYSVANHLYITPHNGFYLIMASCCNIAGMAIGVNQGTVGLVGAGRPADGLVNPFFGFALNQCEVAIFRDCAAGDTLSILCQTGANGGPLGNDTRVAWASYTLLT